MGPGRKAGRPVTWALAKHSLNGWALDLPLVALVQHRQNVGCHRMSDVSQDVLDFWVVCVSFFLREPNKGELTTRPGGPLKEIP